MSFLAITLPVSLLLGAVLLGIVIWEVRGGAFDDWEGPAHRMLFDDDRIPEREDDHTPD
jgi:cbb3-type cytochrome oxidase maturation protein